MGAKKKGGKKGKGKGKKGKKEEVKQEETGISDQCRVLVPMFTWHCRVLIGGSFVIESCRG